MGLPQFNTFDLNDTTYITETVEHRTRASRRLESEVISRRMGMALLNTQVQQKVIQVSGTILASSVSGLQTAVDNLHKFVSAIEGDLVIESGRTYRATAERINIPDQRYNQTLARFEIQFVCSQPFSEGSSVAPVYIVPSGTNTKTISTTISGSAPNRPSFRFVLPSGQGVSPVVQIDIQYASTANVVTISGTNFSPGSTIIANYDRYLVTVDGVNHDFVGQMDEIDAGDATFYVTISGRNNGTRGTIEYSPRYW